MALVWNAVVLNERAGHADTAGHAHRGARRCRTWAAAWWSLAGAVFATGTDRHRHRSPRR